MMFAIDYFGGLENHGNAGLVILALLVIAVCYVALGMIMGSFLTVNQNSVGYTLILLLTIFGGAWMDVEAISGVFNSVAQALPFAHALGAARDVMQHGAGLADIAADLLWVLGYTVAAVAAVGAAVLVFRRRMVE